MILRKLMSGKNLVLRSYRQKCGILAVFYKHQHPGKESINILDYLLKDNHQGKVASEITIFGWVWLGVLLAYYDHQNLCKESIDILDFLHGYNHY